MTLEEAVDKAFNSHREKLGDHWSWSWGVSENRIEDFAADLLANLGIKLDEQNKQCKEPSPMYNNL